MSESRNIVIGVSWSRKYGDHEISLKVAYEVEISSTGDRRREFDNVMRVLDDQFEQIERDYVPAMSDTQTRYKSTPDTDIVTIPVEEVRVETNKGDKRVRIAGGRFSKWGVDMYPDAEFAEGQQFYDWDYGNHDVTGKGWIAEVQMVGGSPKRVLRIN